MLFSPTRARCVLTAVAVLVLPAVWASAADPARLTVKIDQPGVKISPLLYGIFFEEINRAGEGGLYGEMLQNRSFEDDRGDRDQKPTKIPGWRLVEGPGPRATIGLDSTEPLNPRNPTSLRIENAISAVAPAAVANEGFNGLALVKGASYNLSFYARSSAETDGQVRARLEDASGVLSAERSIAEIGRQWKQYRCTLTAKATTVHGRLVLAYPSRGTLWLDQVSLFPENTWKGRPNGLRPDLAEMLADLKPAFNRFPGGCYVEGNRLANAFRWKNSIGDLAERPGHWNLWGYRSTDGLGYHEYLQFCEDIGAAPLFVINCGMAHENSVPNDKLGPWIQDALDAIEYANGPVDSPWGSLRAKAGHPAPFNLRQIEIGNENGGPVYEDHYRQFHDAIKAKYPEMVLVANTPVKSCPMDVLDEHYYDSPEFFMRNANRYDAYDRKTSPKIYVGEYAVTQNCGKGNLRAAVGEAAFMTGMERNADIVVMSSYAPLFVNCGWRQWNPNAINFDNSRVYGTPSYYVQKMFSANRGDVVLAQDFQVPAVSIPSSGGAIGVGTWNTQAEFKDIKVVQGDKLLFQSDFSTGFGDWRTYQGQWHVKDGALQQTDVKEDVRAVAGDKSWKDYTLTLKARKLGGAEGFLILFDLQDEHAKSWWNVGGWSNTRHGLELDGASAPYVDGRIEKDRWYDIRVENVGDRIRCYLDGKLVHDARRSPLDSLYAVASRAEKSGDVILKVVNAIDKPQEVRIVLAGLKGKVKSGTLTVLSSADPMDENSLENPGKVVPQESPLADAGAEFVHTFPGNSVSVIRLAVGADASAESARPDVREAPPKLQEFSLQDVRLLDGPFRDAMELDKVYLLSLDPDRLLHTFRLTAGLPTSAKPYGGWEAPGCELRGHCLGHYLSACALMYASTGDERLKARVDGIVAELAKCQAALPAKGYNKGFLSAYPEGFFDRVDAGKRVWAPYYTLHKIMAGLLDAHLQCDNRQALEVLNKMADWLKFRIGRLSHAQQQKALGNEHGGMNEVLANLYAVTANPDHLRLARDFNHEAIFEPLAHGLDKLDGKHANTQIPKITGAARQFELTGDKSLLAVAATFWRAVALNRSYAIGGDSDGEHFFPVADFAKHLSPVTSETCNTYNMLKLTRHLFAVEPSAELMDFYERGLYNQILGSIDLQKGMVTYFVPLRPGDFKVYSTPENSFWCCTGTGMENHAKYADTIFFHDDRSLYLNLFIPSELNWKAKGLTIRQETRFPDTDRTRLEFHCQKPVSLALKIRWPAWAQKGMQLTVNGAEEKFAGKPGSYVDIQREWREGDVVEIRLPMSLRTEPLPGNNPRIVAIFQGPIVLAGELGTQGLDKFRFWTDDQTVLGRMPTPPIPQLVCEPDELIGKLAPVPGKPMTYQTKGIGRPAEVTLSPLYKLHYQRYAVYWKLGNSSAK